MRVFLNNVKSNIINYNRLYSIAISCFIIYLIFYVYDDLDFKKIIDTSKDIDFIFFIAAVLSLLCSHYFASMKYCFIVNKIILPRNKIKTGYIAYFSALFANIVPFGPTADICRVTMLKANHQISLSNGFLISIIDRVSSAIYIAFIGVCFLILQLFYSYNLNIFKVLLVFWSLIVTVCIIFFFFPDLKIFEKKLIFGRRLLEVKRILWSISFNSKVAFFTMAQFVFVSLSIIFCMESIINFKYNIHVILLTPFIQTLQTVPFFFGGWGIREASFLYLIPSNGSSQNINEILTISILFGVCIFVSVLPSFLFLNRNYNNNE